MIDQSKHYLITVTSENKCYISDLKSVYIGQKTELECTGLTRTYAQIEAEVDTIRMLEPRNFDNISYEEIEEILKE